MERESGEIDETELGGERGECGGGGDGSITFIFFYSL